MTDCRPTTSNPVLRPATGPRAPRGFTLTELLIVIGIITILIGITLPVVFRARAAGHRARIGGDLQTISIALENYKLDFGDYPRLQQNLTPTGIAPDVTGAQLLCWALISPGGNQRDGATGPGLRVRPASKGLDGIWDTADDVAQGKVYGPYVPPDKLKIASQASIIAGNPTPALDNTDVILDSQGNPILYFAATPRKPDITVIANVNGVAVPGFVARGSLGVGCCAAMLYDADQNLYLDNLHPGVATYIDGATVSAFTRTADATPANTALFRMRVILGDTNADGIIGVGETAATTGPYLLWSAGVDGYFGPDDPANPSSVSKCDDVTNFR